MADLRDLIERVERLDEPSREVDALLHAIVAEGRTVRQYTHPVFGPQLLARNSRPPHDEYWLDHPISVYPEYTSSLNAAMELCERVRPESWHYLVDAASRKWYLDRPQKPDALARYVVLEALRAIAKEGRT